MFKNNSKLFQKQLSNFSLKKNIFPQMQQTSKPNERWCRFFGIYWWLPPPPLTVLSSKCHNFFSIWPLLRLRKYVRQKFSLCLFSKKQNWICLFPTLFTPFFQKLESFLPKIAYIGGKQTNWNFFKTNEMFECLRCFCIP